MACLAASLLMGCGGDGSSDSLSGVPSEQPSGSCAVSEQKKALRDYMQTAYLWSDLAPLPTPEAYGSLEQYFPALLFTGSATLPADRWSYLSDTDQYNQFFQEGQTRGYGLSVNGLEGRLPLRIRYVEPQSPAAGAGLQRGDVIASINGVHAAALLASGDFSALVAGKEGDSVVLTVENASGVRTVVVTAATYALQPVAASGILTGRNGRPVGYVSLKDFIAQAEAPLEEAIGHVRAAGATDLIVDLRYNGGGRISTANKLASLIAGSAHDGKVFVRLQHNVKVRYLDAEYTLASSAPGFSRVVILTGSRTCSASELLANGLTPYLEVVTLGSQTCGKPFGFRPVESCGKTISAVNFESFNAKGEGRYYQGLSPACSFQDDFIGPLGVPQEALTAAALSRLDTGVCPRVALSAGFDRRAPAVRPVGGDAGEFRGMRAD